MKNEDYIQMPSANKKKGNSKLPQKNDVVKDLKELEEKFGFEIRPCEDKLDVANNIRYEKLEIDAHQKESISMLLGLIPQGVSSGTLLHTYIAKFPTGMPAGAELVKSVKDPGGVLSAIYNNKKDFVGHATFHSTEKLGVVLSVFTLMSLATGQYFLSRINSKLGNMEEKLDEVLEFLKGEKNSELLAEIGFVKYAYRNLNSIVMSDSQKVATIVNIQGAKKVAIKDMEFYTNSLESLKRKTGKTFEEICKSCENAFAIAKDIEMSRNLYIFSSLLEVYYSRNFDPAYIDYLREEAKSYIKAGDESLASVYQALKMQFENYKYGILEMKKDNAKKKNMDLLVSRIRLSQGQNSEVFQTFDRALKSINSSKEYILTNNGDVYIKKDYLYLN